ncbi:MAG: AEC family transporter [Clostridia bacterium]|nr:AEC family transporter [Clostridia bacterium]
MLDSFIYSLNIIGPIFIIVVLGAILKKYGFFKEGFLSVCDKLVFKICLPCLLFQDIVTADSSEGADLKLILFCVIAVAVSFLLPCLIVPIFVKDNGKRGAFIQGVYRSNSAILGVTMASSMFGDTGASVLATVLPFTVTMFNVFAVILLSFFAPADTKLSPKALFRRIIMTIVTNPLIIGIVLAMLWRLTGLSLPMVVDRSLSYLSDLTMPLALISLGANFTFESLRGRLGLAIASSACKTIVVPALTVGAAILMGFRGVQLGVVFILFGGPAAVSSYIMAKQMKSDHELASQILLISTLMSVFTLFAGIFLLKQTGLI